jgi:alpha-amylase
MERVAHRCYAPALNTIQRVAKKWGTAFTCAFSLTGVAVEQLRLYAPGVVERIQELVSDSSAEILGETYYHSLASILDEEDEFAQQVNLHREMLQREFGVQPKVFRNTELIYSDRIAKRIKSLGFTGVIAEGIPELLEGLPARKVYSSAEAALKILTRDYGASDEIGFRFTAGSKSGEGFSAEHFVRYLNSIAQGDDLVTLYLDFETFGEHYPETSGILKFLEDLPEQLIKTQQWHLLTPSQAIEYMPAVGVMQCSRERSWADSERDLSAWLGNSMQQKAFNQLHHLPLEHSVDMTVWRYLQTSDHFYYMCTKSAGDGDVHKHFSPFESPYDAFIAFMNVLRSLNAKLM